MSKVFQMRLLDGSEHEETWVEVSEEEFNTSLINPTEWQKRILYTHPLEGIIISDDIKNLLISY